MLIASSFSGDNFIIREFSLFVNRFLKTHRPFLTNAPE